MTWFWPDVHALLIQPNAATIKSESKVKCPDLEFSLVSISVLFIIEFPNSHIRCVSVYFRNLKKTKNETLCFWHSTHGNRKREISFLALSLMVVSAGGPQNSVKGGFCYWSPGWRFKGRFCYWSQGRPVLRVVSISGLQADVLRVASAGLQADQC